MKVRKGPSGPHGCGLQCPVSLPLPTPTPPKQHTVQKREPWADMERSGAGVTLPGVTLNTLTHPPSLSSLFSGGRRCVT